MFQNKGVLNSFPVFSFQNFPHVLAETCITEDFPRSQGGVVAFNIFWEVRSFLCKWGSTALRPSILDRPSQVAPWILSAPQLEHGNLMKVPTDFVTPAATNGHWGHHRPAQKNGTQIHQINRSVGATCWKGWRPRALICGILGIAWGNEGMPHQGLSVALSPGPGLNATDKHLVTYPYMLEDFTLKPIIQRHFCAAGEDVVDSAIVHGIDCLCALPSHLGTSFFQIPQSDGLIGAAWDNPSGFGNIRMIGFFLTEPVCPNQDLLWCWIFRCIRIIALNLTTT